MAVEDELRGGAIPDIKPRILTDQVCAWVYIFYHPYLLKESCPKTVCITLTSYPEHSVKWRRSNICSCHRLHLFPSLQNPLASYLIHFTIDCTRLSGELKAFIFFVKWDLTHHRRHRSSSQGSVSVWRAWGDTCVCRVYTKPLILKSIVAQQRDWTASWRCLMQNAEMFLPLGECICPHAWFWK